MQFSPYFKSHLKTKKGNPNSLRTAFILELEMGFEPTAYCNIGAEHQITNRMTKSYMIS